MATRALFARRFLYLRLLAATLAVGSALDLALASVLVFAPRAASVRLGLSLPEEPFYLWLPAALLVALAALYLLAARDPRRYSGIIAAAIGARLLVAAALAGAALGRSEAAPLAWLAAGELGLGLCHAGFWLPVRS